MTEESPYPRPTSLDMDESIPGEVYVAPSPLQQPQLVDLRVIGFAPPGYSVNLYLYPVELIAGEEEEYQMEE